MKKMICICAVALGMTAAAETTDPGAYVTNGTPTSISEVMEIAGWDAADLLEGLAMLERLYANDVATETGRKRWHGDRVSESVDTNAMTKTITYRDGTEFTEKAHIVTALSAVRKANAKAARAVMTNGIPVRLAQARLQQAKNAATTNEVTVSIKAGDGNAE